MGGAGKRLIFSHFFSGMVEEAKGTFLQGVFEFSCVWVMVFCGEVVVECVVNVVGRMVFFRGRTACHFFELYF